MCQNHKSPQRRKVQDHMNKRLVTAICAGFVIIALAGCSKATERFEDAPKSGRDHRPAEVIDMPDGFNNVADKCDSHGNRVYVIFHNTNNYGAISVVPSDPTCQATTR